jgi:hypothetical protein
LNLEKFFIHIVKIFDNSFIFSYFSQAYENLYAMNKILIFTLITMSAHFSMASDSTLVKHEIGINTFSVLEMDYDQFYYWVNPDKRGFSPHYFTGLMYKFHFGNSAIRASFDYYYLDDLFTEFDFQSNSSYRKTEYRLGFQKTYGLKKATYFIALDLLYSGEYYDSDVDLGVPYQFFTLKVQNHFGGIAPAIGGSYQIAKHFSVSAEMNFRIALQYRKSNNDDFQYKGASLIFNPVRLLSINYNF